MGKNATNIMGRSWLYVLMVVTVSFSDGVHGSQLTNRLFEWTRHAEDYVSEGKMLSGHSFLEYSHKYVVSQCAMECLRHSKCKSFNFDQNSGKCELNGATHLDFPANIMDNKNTEYHVRDSFSIDPNALGPCAADPCNGKGYCIETKNAADDLVALCLCNEGWTGSSCQSPAHTLDWGPWEEWGQCSVTCGRGWRMRKRKCMDQVTNQAVSELECYGAGVEYGVCVLQDCPRWEEWGEWETCSASTMCGPGAKLRHRVCANGGVPGVDRYCLGSTNESSPCQGIDCRGAMRLSGGVEHGEGGLEVFNDVTGEWGRVCVDQMTPTTADLACRQMGFPGAHAVVTDGRYSVGDEVRIALTNIVCKGDERTLLQCQHNPWSLNSTCNTGSNIAGGVQCNVNGAWSLWSSWGECSVTCENGTRQRTRQCNHPPQKHQGKACEGDTVQYKPCTMKMCPSNGTWGEWGAWSTCNSQCGPGTQSRVRTCISSQPCVGPSNSTQECHAGSCAVDGVWTAWTDWSTCSLTCGNGTQDRTRTCHGPFYEGADCTGHTSETQGCKVRECPVDGVWEQWEQWSPCSLSCGNGTRARNRTCTGPFYDGKDCAGDREQWEPCNTHNCPVDGEWFQWEQWQPCNVTCGGGFQIRERKCNTPQFGGKTCHGASQETRDCGHTPCPIDGVWLPWSEWGTCSVTCGDGTQYRNRTCDGPYYGGDDCVGNATDSRHCHPRMCPVDGHWMDWEPWSPCTRSCGGGSRTRERECYHAQHGGKSCDGHGNETEDCGIQGCPVDGVWQEWTEWSQCSHSCGNGSRVRTRDCQGPFHGGANCTGPWDETENCNPDPCPVDGVILDWSSWSECSLTCGGGERSRNRECYGPFHGGAMCAEHLNESESCNEKPCPVDGVWQEWSEWSSCSVTCGGGSRDRDRACYGPFHGGANCSGAWRQNESCNIHHCPVDGVWSAWSDWELCDVTCGGGQQWRHRDCDGPRYGGANCQGSANQSQACNTHPCPVDGLFSDWSQWSECDVTCGGGVKQRNRTCVGPFFGGKDCEGAKLDNHTCNAHVCPVDGVWEEWTQWSMCTVTCGGGKQKRTRICNGPFFGGAECPGPNNQTQSCNVHHCPEDGLWLPWAPWSKCSVSCGGGHQHRERICKLPKIGAKNCTGDSLQNRTCSTHRCPVDGVFSSWSEWSECSLSCGSGRQWRNRTCVGPFHGGLDCQGERNERRDCNVHFCPVDGYYEGWSAWGACSVSCGGGSQHRNRSCVMPKYGGQPCEGAANQTQACNTHHCPVDGFYYAWSDWSACSLSCGRGSQWRNRICEPPKYGGKDCKGPANTTQNCNTQPCPIDGVWKEWSDWSACNTTCGGGMRERVRVCIQPKHQGKPCKGHSAEYLACADNPCPIPGKWFAWTSWSECTVTCGGGKRERSRDCDMTSYGNLTAPCEGDAEQVVDCHTFACKPYARTCTEWQERGLTVTTEADIDPDGEAGSLEPVNVTCDFDIEPGHAVTVIGHDSEQRKRVQGWEGAREYQQPITYNISIEHVVSIVDQSASCKQYICWECKAALIHNPNDNNKVTTGWLNRTEGLADYFGGALPGSKACACGMSGNCTRSDDLCNCDANDNTWRSDEGDLTYKDDLPVMAFVAGDTGGQKEDGYQTVGPVRCFGAANQNSTSGTPP